MTSPITTEHTGTGRTVSSAPPTISPITKLHVHDYTIKMALILQLATTHFKLAAEETIPDTNDDNAALLSSGLRYLL